MAQRQLVMPASDDEVRKQIPETLAKLAEPATANGVRGALPKSCQRDVKALIALLDEAAEAGDAYRLPKGKTVRYAARGAQALAAEALLATVDETPRDWTELKKRGRLKKAAGWVTTQVLDTAREGLIREGRVHKWPKVGPVKVERYATRPMVARDPADFVGPLVAKFQKDLNALAKALAKAGAKPADVEAAARQALGWTGETQPAETATEPTVSEVELERRVLDAMTEVDLATMNGAPVSFSSLRARMLPPLTDKATFDQAVWRVGTKGRVSLHRHHFPAGCTQAERDAMVPDGQGGFYYSISRRLEG